MTRVNNPKKQADLVAVEAYVDIQLLSGPKTQRVLDLQEDLHDAANALAEEFIRAGQSPSPLQDGETLGLSVTISARGRPVTLAEWWEATHRPRA
jgi:hypothetical protein